MLPNIEASLIPYLIDLNMFLKDKEPTIFDKLLLNFF